MRRQRMDRLDTSSRPTLRNMHTQADKRALRNMRPRMETMHWDSEHISHMPWRRHLAPYDMVGEEDAVTQDVSSDTQ